MVSKPDLFEDLDYLSGMVSDRTRVINVAILAVWWGKFVGESAASDPSWLDRLFGKVPTVDLSPRGFLVPALLAFFSLICDFLQYAAVFVVRRHVVLNYIEDRGIESFRYNKKHWTYRLREALFYLKQAAMIAGLIWFLALLIPSALRP